MSNSPDPYIAWNIILTIGVLVAIGANAVSLVRPKQKREVSFEFTPASKEEFERHVEVNNREHENLFAKIGGVERGARQQIGDEVAKINSDRRQSLETLNRRNERMMFALGKIAQKLDVNIEPTE